MKCFVSSDVFSNQTAKLSSCNREVRYRVYKSLPLNYILSQLDPFRISHIFGPFDIYSAIYPKISQEDLCPSGLLTTILYACLVSSARPLVVPKLQIIVIYLLKSGCGVLVGRCVIADRLTFPWGWCDRFWCLL